MGRKLRTADNLYNAVAALVDFDLGANAALRMRGGIGGAELTELLIWNVMIASFVHLGCHILGDKICNALKHNSIRLGRHDRSAIEDARTLVSHAIDHPLLKIPHIADEDQQAATDAVTTLLTDTGIPKTIASRKAQETVKFLIAIGNLDGASASG